MTAYSQSRDALSQGDKSGTLEHPAMATRRVELGS